MSKSAAHDLFEQFYVSDGKRVRRYVAMIARRHGMPRELYADLLQAAWLEASLACHYWRPTGGKSLFNWCAGPMRRAVIRCHRAHCGARPYGRDGLLSWAPLRGAHGAVEAPNLPERIDLHRALAADPKPREIMRLIMCALSVANGAEIARSDNRSKQAISEHLAKARARLRLHLAG